MPASSQDQPKRRKPLGKLAPLTPEEMDALATITPADIEAIMASPSLDPELAKLLDATPVKK